MTCPSLLTVTLDDGVHIYRSPLPNPPLLQTYARQRPKRHFGTSDAFFMNTARALPILCQR